MPMVKIVYVINHPFLHGSNRSLLNLIEGLNSKAIIPFVIMAMEGDMCIKLKEIKVPYKVVPHQFCIYPDLPCNSFKNFIFFVPRLFLTVYKNLIATVSLVRIAKEFHADIIHTNIGPDFIGYFTARVLGIPHVWHIREYHDLHYHWHIIPSKRNFIKKLKKRGNYPVAISHGLFEHYKMASNGRVIYNGIYKKNQTRFNSEKSKYFLFVGRLEFIKGIEQVLEAFFEFARTNYDYKLKIAGDGDEQYKALLLKKVNTIGFSERIDFLEFKDNIDELMANATALIVASSYEGFGRVTAEAMFNGCLVVGLNSGGTKEILEKDNLGLLYHNHNELVSIMNTIVSKGINKYFPIIQKAQKKALELYSVEKNVIAFQNMYAEILNNIAQDIDHSQ